MGVVGDSWGRGGDGGGGWKLSRLTFSCPLSLSEQLSREPLFLMGSGPGGSCQVVL